MRRVRTRSARYPRIYHWFMFSRGWTCKKFFESCSFVWYCVLSPDQRKRICRECGLISFAVKAQVLLLFLVAESRYSGIGSHHYYHRTSCTLSLFVFATSFPRTCTPKYTWVNNWIILSWCVGMECVFVEIHPNLYLHYNVRLIDCHFRLRMLRLHHRFDSASPFSLYSHRIDVVNYCDPQAICMIFYFCGHSYCCGSTIFSIPIATSSLFLVFWFDVCLIGYQKLTIYKRRSYFVAHLLVHLTIVGTQNWWN